ATEALKELLDSVEDSGPWPAWFRAENELQRAFIQARRRSYAKAAMSGRTAYGLYESIVEEHPAFAEAYKGRGLLRIMIGSVPGSFRWVLNTFGYGGTVEEGMDDLRKAARESRFGAVEAELMLCLADVTVNNSRNDGDERLGELYQTQQDSPLVGWLYAFALVSNREVSKAGPVLERAYAQTQESGRAALPFIDYYLGDVRYTENDFEAARTHFVRFVDTFAGSSLKADALLKAGISSEMLGDVGRAFAYYHLVDSPTEFDSDRRAKKEAARRLEGQMSHGEKDQLRAVNAFDGGRYAETRERFEQFMSRADASPRDSTIAHYYFGRAYHAESKLPPAAEAYRYVVNNPIGSDERWAPWAQYYLGEVLEEQGNPAAARRAYAAALQYRGEYDYKNGLESRAKAGLRRTG
ncbi:MAG: tetratricopeptide repeat protein, partial [Bacteroidota bacterium]